MPWKQGRLGIGSSAGVARSVSRWLNIGGFDGYKVASHPKAVLVGFPGVRLADRRDSLARAVSYLAGKGYLVSEFGVVRVFRPTPGTKEGE